MINFLQDAACAQTNQLTKAILEVKLINVTFWPKIKSCDRKFDNSIWFASICFAMATNLFANVVARNYVPHH